MYVKSASVEEKKEVMKLMACERWDRLQKS